MRRVSLARSPLPQEVGIERNAQPPQGEDHRVELEEILTVLHETEYLIPVVGVAVNVEPAEKGHRRLVAPVIELELLRLGQIGREKISSERVDLFMESDDVMSVGL